MENIQNLTEEEFKTYIQRSKEETKVILAKIKAMKELNHMALIYQSKDKKTLEVIRNKHIEIYTLKMIDNYKDTKGMSQDSEVEMCKGCNFHKVNYDSTEEQ
jgi:hypothetical protein